MTKIINSYENQISNLLKTFYSIPQDPKSVVSFYIELDSPDHVSYFLDYIEKLRSFTTYYNFVLNWWLITPTKYNNNFVLRIELYKNGSVPQA